jgi:hypothetical protein
VNALDARQEEEHDRRQPRGEEQHARELARELSLIQIE